MNGTFKARAKEWGIGKSPSDATKLQLSIMFQLIGGEHDGQYRTYYGSFSEAAVDITLNAMRACGWDGDEIRDLSGMDANEVELVIAEEEYDGKVRDKVKWVNRPASLKIKNQLTPDELSMFSAKLRGKALAHKQKYGAQPAPTNTKHVANGAGQRSDGSWPDDGHGPGYDDYDGPY